MRVSMCEFRNVGQNIGCVDDELRYTDGQISSSSSQESRSQGRRRRWTSAGYQSGSLGKPPCQTPSQDSAATGDESAGQAREEVNKPRNQPRRGGLGSHMFAVLDWIGGDGERQLIWRCEASDLEANCSPTRTACLESDGRMDDDSIICACIDLPSQPQVKIKTKGILSRCCSTDVLVYIRTFWHLCDRRHAAYPRHSPLTIPHLYL